MDSGIEWRKKIVKKKQENSKCEWIIPTKYKSDLENANKNFTGIIISVLPYKCKTVLNVLLSNTMWL